MPQVRSWAKDWNAQSVDLTQCAFGGEFQKLTTIMYTYDLSLPLSSLATAVCTHGSSAHTSVAHGLDKDGGYVTAQAAAYPPAFNLALARAIAFPSAPCVADRVSVNMMSCHDVDYAIVPQVVPSMVTPSVSDPFIGPLGLRAGAARPHAALGDLGPSREARATPSANPRRLEPELSSVLRVEGLPRVNVPPVTSWALAPTSLSHPLPNPLTTHQLIPLPMQSQLREFRISVRACFEAARRGRWRWARDHRPKPLHATLDQCLMPAGRDHVWLQSPEDGLWRPLEPSSWPLQPPDGELDIAVIIDVAVEMGYDDMEIISLMAHGYPGPTLDLETVLGPPHVGALKNPTAFDKCANKDREKGWVRWGSSLPPVWPMRADPMNAVLRHGKPRMTIDKTMELVEGVPSYNHVVDLTSQPEIEYVRVNQLSRSAAILMTAGVRVKLWGFDLEAYFRKTGKQRAHWWMSGFVHADGYGYDPRIQFGQREAPVLCGRQSCFLIAAVRRELSRLDRMYPSRVPTVVQWLYDRGSVTMVDVEPMHALFFTLMFVDDVGGASIDDQLYDSKGSPNTIWLHGAIHHQSRAELHYSAAIGVVRTFGHTDAVDKGVPPADDMVFLGLTIDLGSSTTSLTDLKVDSYTELLLAVLSGAEGVCTHTSVFAKLDSFNSLVHKLLHACVVVVLGRQHLFHCLRALRVSTSMRAGIMVPVAPAVEVELRWWMLALERARVEGVPLASRTSFPDASASGVLAPYSDASRELASPESSGYGAWAIVSGVFVYVYDTWLPWELASLSINVLELAAMQFGTFTFIDYAKSSGVAVTHVMEFTDNTAAEHSAERGRPHTERMHTLVSDRYRRLTSLKVHSSIERVASVDNDVADGLSRGGLKVAEALRIAAGTCMPMRRLVVPAAVRSLEELRSMT